MATQRSEEPTRQHVEFHWETFALPPDIVSRNVAAFRIRTERGDSKTAHGDVLDEESAHRPDAAGTSSHSASARNACAVLM